MKQPTKKARPGKALVIVESPAKARTIGSILGGQFHVRASLGHVRDLPKSQLGVEVERDFAPKYLIPKEKRAVVRELEASAKGASSVYLATDPDREGEAIAWHLVQAAGLPQDSLHRVVFHEITRQAIQEAFAHPRGIDLHLVNAQQARRILDRLVGYGISPLLWRKIRGGLSAGRVQSVALRMTVEREREIESFVPREYWSIEADLAPSRPAPGRGRDSGASSPSTSLPTGPAYRTGRQAGSGDSFRAALVGLVGERTKLEVGTEVEAQRLVGELALASYRVAQVRHNKSSRQPPPPFITSTLQQEAFRKLRFSAQRTMAIAQQLYEGLPLGGQGTAGLITYMRTDSTQMASTAQQEIRDYITARYGTQYLPTSARRYRKVRGAQEAHEAIRPTSVGREPAQMRARLTSDQFRLYELVWKRTVASQMAAAAIATTAVDVEASRTQGEPTYLLRASSYQVTFPGFQALYSEDRDEEEQTSLGPLPGLRKGEALTLLGLSPEQHFTQPPPRYNEATLIRALEDNGIGRPSTYASILSTLQDRSYVERVERHLRPLELGVIVNDLLTEHFPDIVDVGFTAQMETELDQIAAGKRQWVQLLKEFYAPFQQSVEEASIRIEKISMPAEPTGELCDQCSKPLVIKQGRYGKFLACSGYPACRNTRPLQSTIGVACPKCGSPLVERRTRQRRRVFYGCSSYPACDFTSWQRPLPARCASCGGLLVQYGQRRAKCLQCGHTSRQGSPAQEAVPA